MLKKISEIFYKIAHAGTPARDLMRIEILFKKKPNIDRIKAWHKAGIKDEQGRGCLHTAASCGKFEIVKALAEYGADLNQVDHLGYTPLLCAVIKGSAETVAYLLAAGADAGIKGGVYGHTPLRAARHYGFGEIERLLQDNPPGKPKPGRQKGPVR